MLLLLLLLVLVLLCSAVLCSDALVSPFLSPSLPFALSIVAVPDSSRVSARVSRCISPFPFLAAQCTRHIIIHTQLTCAIFAGDDHTKYDFAALDKDGDGILSIEEIMEGFEVILHKEFCCESLSNPPLLILISNLL